MYIVVCTDQVKDCPDGGMIHAVNKFDTYEHAKDECEAESTLDYCDGRHVIIYCGK